MDDAAKLMEAAIAARGKDLTPEQIARREWVERRNEVIQRVAKPVDGVTFGKKA